MEMVSESDSQSNPPNQPDLASQLANAVALVAKEDQVVWTIFGVFWAANVLLLGALFVTGSLPHRVVGVTLSGVGVAFCLVWTLIQWRALHFLAFYERVQRLLEEDLFKDKSHLALSRKFNETVFNQAGWSKVPVRGIMMGSSIGISVLWLLGVIVFLRRGCP
jgi:hypothetical protein